MYTFSFILIVLGALGLAASLVIGLVCIVSYDARDSLGASAIALIISLLMLLSGTAVSQKIYGNRALAAAPPSEASTQSEQERDQNSIQVSNLPDTHVTGLEGNGTKVPTKSKSSDDRKSVDTYNPSWNDVSAYSFENGSAESSDDLMMEMQASYQPEQIEITEDSWEHSDNTLDDQTAPEEQPSDQNEQPQGECTISLQEAKLIRVVDGDTIVVSIDGVEYKVRLIGVNTPESVAPDNYRTENTEEGYKASDYVKALMGDVDTVYLESDQSDKDRYDRLLRYVWLSVPYGEITSQVVAEQMLNGMLLTGEKVAEPAEYKPNTKYARIFEDIYYNYS